MKTITTLLCPPVLAGCCICAVLLYTLPIRVTWKAPTARSVSSEPLLSEIVKREAAKYGLHPAIVFGLINHESRFNDRAFNPEKKSRCYQKARNAVERRSCGSKGLMQVVSRWHGGERDTLEQHIARGVGILGRHYTAAKGIRNPQIRAMVALRKYNGTGAAARRYAGNVLREARYFGYK